MDTQRALRAAAGALVRDALVRDALVRDALVRDVWYCASGGRSAMVW
jgi:hypothetical protein